MAIRTMVIGMPARGVAALAVIAACGSRPPPAVAPRPPPAARIEVAPSTCPPPLSTASRLRAVLIRHGAEHGDLIIRVEAVDIAPGTRELQLRVVRGSGDVGLDRRYTLAPADCDSAAELLAVAVDRFLSEFPEWAGPAPPPPPPPVQRSRWLELHLVSAVNAIAPPLGVDGQVGALADYGARGHRFGGSLILRATVPQAAGSGRFQQTALLAGATWRRRAGAWDLRAEARGGVVRVTGIGFAENGHDWLPWWEGAVFAGLDLSWGAIGVEVAATGLRDRAVTRDGLVSEDIPLFRIGLAAEILLGSQKP